MRTSTDILRRVLAIALVSVGSGMGLQGQESAAPETDGSLRTQSMGDSTDTTFSASSRDDRSWDLGGFPVIFYSDQTRWAGGAGGQIILKGSSDAFNSNIGIVLFYSQNKQYTVGLQSELALDEGHARFRPEFFHAFWPDQFYGVGNSTRRTDQEDYSARKTALRLTYLQRVYASLYIGPQYSLHRSTIYNVQSGGMMDTQTVSGKSGGLVSGFGVALMWDSRDDNIYPTRGGFHQLSAGSYGSFAGSDYTYEQYLLDARQYTPLFGDHVLAIRAAIGISTGDTPYYLMNHLGGYLRGYYPTRFVDKNVFAVQADYRMPLIWRFGLVGFAGAGQVAKNVSGFSLSEMKPSVGFGIRFALLPEQKLNLRMDFGVGKDDGSFDINLSEAF